MKKYVIRHYEKKGKLIGHVSDQRLWFQNMKDEWIHDVYEESYIHYGKIYSVHEPFHRLSTSVTGYFQDEDTNKWIKVCNGVGDRRENEKESVFGWKESLEELIRTDLITMHLKKGV
ncbi:molecular chaperone GrpE [Alkalihalobacillus sp. MEB130]|uniref:molecular chaperone GrpE n=1 Tax=Alkalihalobacillus sp. MEB130 TaxID=2976704 RepID=UPI0028DD482E|nr:molecular chaperone GrpE [Alkalihalobacillus sp. MEB130]MDT8860864.1 molecular chaperone GrpE [Alkalihalobacillus sp. MEB130]